MEPFRTIVKPDKPVYQISHQDKLISVGSCFSENIGTRFQQHKFDIVINPFGQQYNPVSICNGINRLLDGKPYTQEELFFHNEQWHSFDHHSCFSDTTAEGTLHNINNMLATAAEQLRHASVVFLTLGTAHVFERNDTKQIVSNCHKLPGTQFTHRILEIDEIVGCMQQSVHRLMQVNPKVQIVLTVSPVRYFAFGAYSNSVSKSHLFAAIHQLSKMFRNTYYFPAYEIVIDELRDYRFYAEDMLHPNNTAIEYVWNVLSQTFFDSHTLSLNEKIKSIKTALLHRPRNPQSEAHKKFLHNLICEMNELQQTKGLNFTDELISIDRTQN